MKSGDINKKTNSISRFDKKTNISDKRKKYENDKIKGKIKNKKENIRENVIKNIQKAPLFYIKER